MADSNDTRFEQDDDKLSPIKVPPPSGPKADVPKPKDKRETFLSTANTADISDDPNGRKLRYRLRRESIRKTDRSSYLLLGFDTEYQSYEETYTQEDIKAGRAKYEVLSYQFYAINDTGEEWSGIAIPDNGKRLTLGQFLIYALTMGQLRGYTIPSTIVLVGHYNKADIPAFEEREKIFWKLNNIRNSLISLSHPVTVKVSFEKEDDASNDESESSDDASNIGNEPEIADVDDDSSCDDDLEDEPGDEFEEDDDGAVAEENVEDDDEIAEEQASTVDLEVYVRDTILLAPAGRKSLAEIGKLLGLDKIKLADTPEDELLIKKQMKNFRAYDWEMFRPYAIRDAEVSAKYFQLIVAKYQEATGSKFIPVALSNIGVKLLIREWEKRSPPINTAEIVGRELIKETVYNEIRSRFETRTTKPYIEEISWFIDFATECYHGGRNEQLWFGPSFEDDWADYDLTSAYPTAMALIGRPDWKAIRPMTNIDEIEADTLAFACVDFEFPPDVRYPVLPIRTDNGIIFPLAGRSYCAAPEIAAARQLGCKMTLKFGIVVPQDRSELVFFPFIQDSVRRRAEAGTAIEKEFWKEITNSCYGKTAQGLRDKRVFNLRAKKGDRVPQSAISNPFYAAFITSFVRAVVGEFMNAIPPDKMVFSVTTDGFITNATDEEMAVAKQGPLASIYSQVRADLMGDPNVLAEKHHVRQLLGWRTRGQATIKPGEEDGTASKPIVLAKAGIKPPIWATETDEQNNYILTTFFERTIESKIEFDIHTSVREMVLYGADLVSKKLSRRASMEYDFKRKPKAVAMIDVDIPGVETASYQHVAFSTEPWQSINHFQIVRKFWNDYRRKATTMPWSNTAACIKDIADFEEFAEQFDMLSSLAPKDRRYIKAEKGDLRRLQRDLCRAFKHGRAGLDAYNRTLTAKEFAAALNDCGLANHGVKTTRATVENGMKADFTPNATPPTKAVLEILEVFEDQFPLFDRTEILSSPSVDAIFLSAATKNECPFIDRLQPIEPTDPSELDGGPQ